MSSGFGLCCLKLPVNVAHGWHFQNVAGPDTRPCCESLFWHAGQSVASSSCSVPRAPPILFPHLQPDIFRGLKREQTKL